MKKLVLFVLCLFLVGCAGEEVVGEYVSHEGLKVAVPDTWSYRTESEEGRATIYLTPNDNSDVELDINYYDTIGEPATEDENRVFAELSLSSLVDGDTEGLGKITTIGKIKMGHAESVVIFGDYYHAFTFDVGGKSAIVFFKAPTKEEADEYYDQATDILGTIKKD